MDKQYMIKVQPFPVWYQEWTVHFWGTWENEKIKDVLTKLIVIKIKIYDNKYYQERKKWRSIQ